MINRHIFDQFQPFLDSCRDDRASNVPSHLPEPENLLRNHDEGNSEFILNLLREKDEALRNYSEEVEKAQCFEAQLEAA